MSIRVLDLHGTKVPRKHTRCRCDFLQIIAKCFGSKQAGLENQMGRSKLDDTLVLERLEEMVATRGGMIEIERRVLVVPLP